MKNKGFTLIELMVVIVIAGILMAMGAVSFTSMITLARIRGSADQIEAELQGARERAMSRGHTIDVVFSLSGKGGCQMTEIYHRTAGDLTVNVSPFDDCRLGTISPAPGSAAPGATNAPPSSGIDFPSNTLTFQPQGVGTVGAIYIKSLSGKTQYAISVNANGRVQRYLWSGAWMLQ